MLGEYDGRIGGRIMVVCKTCGWGIAVDFDLWVDNTGGAVCFWDRGVEKPHYPGVAVLA